MSKPDIPAKAPASIVPRPVARVSSLSYLSVLLAGAYYQLVSLGWARVAPHQLGVFTGGLAALLALEWFGQRGIGAGSTRRQAVGLLIVRMLLIEAVAAVDPSGFARVLYLLVPFNAYFCLGRRASYGLALLYLGLYLARLAIAAPAWYLGRESLAGLLMFGLGVILTLSMARVAAEAEANRGRAERLLAELTASHGQLRAYAEQAAELAAAEERNRLARDIHDCLGHSLTAVSIQLEKAAAFLQRDPPAAEQALWHARRSTRQALQEVRQSVGTLRQSAELFALAPALSELARNLDSGRLELRLDISGEEAGVPQLVLLSLYRAAQEALTNIQKHAQASCVTLRLAFGDEDVQMAVDDDGRGFDPGLLDRLPPGRQGRFGLHGIKERLAFVEGTMAIQSSPGGGTAVRISVPRRPRTLRAAARSEEAQ